MNKKILYIRNFASKVSPNSYNLQEIGFGKALVRKGYNCDIIYYNDNNEQKIEEIYNYFNTSLRLIWMKGIKILSNSIYSQVLNKFFLSQYDLIITTEYNQLMTYLLSRLCPDKLILYHGPYEDHNNFLIRKTYDKLLLPHIRNKIRYSFVKSDLASRYLQQKGFRNLFTLGVGLDRDKFEEKKHVNHEIEMELNKIKNKKTLLYVGVLEDRRNIEFLMEVFRRLVLIDQSFRIIIVGEGKKEDKEKYWRFIDEHGLENHIIHFSKVDQRFLWQVYFASELMLFPTKYDIFGMVLLESLYFNVPIISSLNGGSSTLLKKGLKGIYVEELDEEAWVNRILHIIDDSNTKEAMNSEQIVENCSWDEIAEVMLKRIAPVS